MAHELNADRARFQTGSVHPAADKAMDSAPAPRISLPTCPRRPLLCPRTSLTVTAKKPAHLPASRQTTRDGIAGEHAAVLRDRRAAAPTSSTRCAKAQLAAESRGSSTGRMRSSSAPRSPRHQQGTEKRFKAHTKPPSTLRASAEPSEQRDRHMREARSRRSLEVMGA